MWLKISDYFNNYDEHLFNITVNNTPPNITTQDLLISMEDEEYYVDYNSSDDDQGTIIWNLETNASWLEFESSTGKLIGTPSNDEKGSYWVNVSIDDGNGGWDWTDYILTVIDTNDAPMIITENVTITYEDDFYSVDYDVIDIDDPTIFVWYLETNTSWLSINKDNGIIIDDNPRAFADGISQIFKNINNYNLNYISKSSLHFHWKEIIEKKLMKSL